MWTHAILRSVTDPPEAFSREDLLGVFTTSEPTPPERLEWTPLMGLLKNYTRLRMNITEANASEELLDAAARARYPEDDVPEIRGLLRVLDDACRVAGVSYRLERGPRELIRGMVGYFEPYKIRLPFAKAILELAIAPAEFQWVLRKSKNEPSENAARLEQLKASLLEGTRQWLRNGNR
jgi:hypothetical protein